MRTGTARIAIVAVLALGLAACGGGGGDGGGNGGGGGDGGGGGGSTLEITAPAGAANSGWATTQLSAPADTPLTIHFVNDDAGIPHNVQVFEGSEATGTPVFAPADFAQITGPDETDYQIPALEAGTYTFNCLSHPTIMVGTLTVS